MATKKTNAKNATGVISIMSTMGDKLNDMWQTTNDRKDATLAVSAYRTAIQAAKTQAYYRKSISSKKRIPFLD
jgi:hypothetical protein